MLKAPSCPATSRSKYRRLMPPPGMHTQSRGLDPRRCGTNTSTATRLQPAGAIARTSTCTVDRRTLLVATSSPVGARAIIPDRPLALVGQIPDALRVPRENELALFCG